MSIVFYSFSMILKVNILRCYEKFAYLNSIRLRFANKFIESFRFFSISTIHKIGQFLSIRYRKKANIEALFYFRFDIRYIYTYKHTCMHAYMHTCIHAYMHTFIHAYMHTCIHAYLSLIHISEPTRPY